MKRSNKVETYSIRKFKVGVSSALIGLSFLGATGLVNDVPVIGDVFGAKEVSARTWKLGEQLTVPSWTSGGPNLGSLGISWNGGAWTLVSSLPDGYTINSVSESGVSLSYKKPENTASNPGTSSSSSSNLGLPWTSGDGSQPGGHNNGSTTSPTPTPTTRTVPASYDIVNRSENNRDSFPDTTVTLFRDGDRWYFDLVAPEGYVLAESGTTNSREYTTDNNLARITIHLKERTFYQGDSNFDLGYTSASRNGGITTITKGTKPTITRTPIDFNTSYIKDESREKGSENITQTEGHAGAIVKTVRHTVDRNTGVVSDSPAEETRVEPVNKVVKVAAKDKVVERELPNRTRYVKDSEKAFGTQNETQTQGPQGHPGREVTRTVYTVNPTNGTITENTTTTRETEPQDKVVKVGGKSTVRTFKDSDGRTVTETTDYTVAEDTGKVTPTTTRTYGNQKDSTETHKQIPSPVIYEKDETREKGQPNLTTNGEPGDEVTTTTYSVNPQTGVVTPTVGKPVRVKEPTPTKVKVAAKDKVVERELPNRTRYVKDSEKAFGTPNETQTQGHPGREVTRTVYTVNPTNGTITEKTTTTRESEPQDKVVKVGGKSTVRTFKDSDGRTVTENTDYNVDDNGVVTPTVTRTYGNQKDSTEVHKAIPSPTVYEKDGEREKGQPNITVNGEPGDEVTTTTYSVNPQTGAVTPTVGKPVRVKEPTPTKVKVAAKDKVVERELPNKIHYVKDSEKEFGTPNETQTEGHPGREVTRTVYTVNPTDGTITEKTTTTRESEPQDGTIKVGAKTKVETYKDDEGRTVNKTTEYNVDETTGIVTPSTTITYGDKKDSTEVHKAIPSPVVYEKDETHDYGEPNQTVNGEPGDEVTTTTYSVNPQTGKVTSKTDNPVVKKEPTPTKVKVAGKTKVVENEIPYKTTYVEDEDSDFGTPNKIQEEGVPGKEKVITTYSVDPKTGEVTFKEEKTKVSDPRNKKVKVGTKPKIGQITENGNLYEVKTIYKLNKETGEVTPETTKRFIKKVQGETKEPIIKTPTEKTTPAAKTALNTGVDAASNIFPILSLIGMSGGIILPIRLKKKD